MPDNRPHRFLPVGLVFPTAVAAHLSRIEETLVGAFVELIRERGLIQRPVLDAACGFGLKTIVMKEAGLNVEGSDLCSLAIEHAVTLARDERCEDIRYFQSSWADLPHRAGKKYAAVFNDALSWIHSDEDMEASLRGLHDVLEPGGILAYMGALPGTSDDENALLAQHWDKMMSEMGKYRLGWQHSDGAISVTECLVLERGSDFIDKHHLYVIDEDGCKRLEAMTMRNVVKWHWPLMEQFLRAAGFQRFGIKEFIAANGRPFHLVTAENSASRS